MPHPRSRVFSLDIIGFSTADRTLIASMFSLSRRRTFQYEEYVESGISLTPRKRPDLFLVDADSWKSLSLLKSKSPDATHPAVLIGHAAQGLAWTLVKRPIKWLELFEALDHSVEQARSAQALIPAENRRGWPFFDRRKKSRLDAGLESKPLSEQPSTFSQPVSALGTMRSAPTVSLLDFEKNRLDHDQGALPVVRDTNANTVLVVDVDHSARGIIQKQLAALNVNIDFASSGEQALGMTARKRYACVLLGTALPGIDAYQTCRLIKAETRQPTPVLMLSAKSHALDRVRARIVGCDAFLDRQAELNTLKHRLASYTASPTRA